MITAKREEMQIVSALPTLQAPWHGCRLAATVASRCD
jgi:hypothetical protein